jgi:hypothetical protein
MSKLKALSENEGFEDMQEFLENLMSDSVCAGICTNDGCEYTTQVEPDQTEGWCEECKTNSVKSGLVIAGII